MGALGPPAERLPAEVADAELDALLERVVVLHDTFKRQEFVFRVRLGHELLTTLYGGRFDEYQSKSRTKPVALRRFCQRHREALGLRQLGEDTLQRCVRVAEFIPDPTSIPEHVTFSHLIELLGLPEQDREWFLKNKVLKGTVSAKELRALVQARLSELRARQIEDEESGFGPEPDPEEPTRPGSGRGYVGNLPRRVDTLLNEVLSVSRDLAPEVVKRPDVAGEALEKWLKVREAADWWVERLRNGEEG
jgi:hypothetical protein